MITKKSLMIALLLLVSLEHIKATPFLRSNKPTFYLRDSLFSKLHENFNAHHANSPIRGGALKQRVKRIGNRSKNGAINTTKKSSSSASPRKIKTQLDFSSDFQHCLQNKEGLNVGKLLLACKKMESTMRRVGMKQSANDLARNIQKVQDSYCKAPIHQRDSMSSLLQWEIESGIHCCVNGDVQRIKLKENSGVIGCLWLGRTVSYQYEMYKHILEKDQDPIQAARLAYRRCLRPHLSWTMQKVAETAITKLTPPQSNTLLAQMGGFTVDEYGRHEEEATKRDLRQILNAWQPLLNEWQNVFTNLGLESI